MQRMPGKSLSAAVVTQGDEVAHHQVTRARYIRMSETITRQEYWRRLYHQRRYLEHAKLDELVQRMRDILSNITALTEDGKIGFLGLEEGLPYWLEMFGHVLEEFKLRKSVLPVGFLAGASIPKPTFPSQPRAASIVRQVQAKFGDKPYVVKLGKAKHLESAFREGRWRLSPASSYSDASLNPAQHDSELQLVFYALNRDVQMEAFDHRTGVSKGKIEPIGDVEVTTKSATDYYVICLSKQLRVRLFSDFDADCCIVIHQPLEFAKRIFEAARRSLRGCEGRFAAVRYIDPYNSRDGRPDVFLSKHFRYCYQCEVRFSWLPDKPVEKLAHVFLELGPLSDISEFFEV
jgi:hypothetical protein